MRTELPTIDEVLDREQVGTVLQPLVDLRSDRILGYEALSRGPGDSPLHNPLVLFDAATEQGRLVELENLCRRRAIEAFTAQGLPGKLFINVTPDTLLQEDFRPGRTRAMLRRVGLPAERVVVELTEHFPNPDYEVLRRATSHYRAMGFSIAIDDLGAGYAGLRLWSELRPDYVKIDKHFIRGIEQDLVKREFVRSIQEIATGLGCVSIAEGVETEGEMRITRSLDIAVGQGYLFGAPALAPPRHAPLALLYAGTNGTNGPRFRLSDAVISLLREAPAVGPETRFEAVGEMFRNAGGLNTIPVVDHAGGPLGIIRRSRFMDLFLSPYGRDLHGRKPVRSLAEPALVVEHDTPVEAVSQQITDGGGEHDFIIARNGTYLGMGAVMDLLRKITDLQIRNARYANPLTQLPGNVPVYEFIDDLLGQGSDFRIAYCDLDHFKPFNDVYGYSQGDEVIKTVAALLLEHMDDRLDFVGHIGGDDFIIILRGADWEARCQAVLDAFAGEVGQFYSGGDRAQGGIRCEDRAGNASFFPLLSLSIGVAHPDPERCYSHHDVAALASEAKHQAKRQPGNSLYRDRRQGPSETEAIPVAAGDRAIPPTQF
ncbi:MAG: GGDEF domain-containing protein [Thiohalospira sp.]